MLSLINPIASIAHTTVNPVEAVFLSLKVTISPQMQRIENKIPRKKYNLFKNNPHFIFLCYDKLKSKNRDKALTVRKLGKQHHIKMRSKRKNNAYGAKIQALCFQNYFSNIKMTGNKISSFHCRADFLRYPFHRNVST